MAKPWKIPNFDARENVAVCVGKILRTRYRETFSHEQGALDGVDVEALHDMRVSARRLKAMMKVFRHVFPKKKFRVEYEWIGNLVRALGAVRDCDVFIGVLEDHKSSIPPRDRRSIDLLIARQKTVRSREQRALHGFFRELHGQHTKPQFLRFVSKSGR